MSAPEAQPQGRPLGAAWAGLCAWTVIGAVNVIATGVDPPVRKLRASDRLLHAAYDFGHALALGLVSCALVLAWSRARLAVAPRLSRRAALVADLAAVAAVSCALAFPLLGDDLSSLASRIVERRGGSATIVRAGLVLAIASGIPAAAILGRLLARRVLRWPAAVTAIAVAAWNNLALTSDYPGVHVYLPWAAAVLGGSAMATLPVRAEPGRRSIVAARSLLACAVLFGAWAMLVRPRELVLLTMLEQRGNMLTTFLARAQRPSWSARRAQVPPELSPWFADRSSAPDVPPTSPGQRSDPIIILYTIDALRAEVVASGRNDASLPELARMKREGVHFTEARSPGSGTVFSVSAMFTGKYYSELYWTHRPGNVDVYPWQDESPRLPDLLAAKGVPTASFVPRRILFEDLGISRGFAEETRIKSLRKGSLVFTGRPLGEAVIDRLDRHDEGPLFLWAHNLDAHEPYDLAGTQGTLYERYLREVAVVDGELRVLREFIEQRGWTDRTTLIVTADHGEGFNEHGHMSHSVSLYEELLRVPLLVVGPGVRPRADATPVTLMDVGPTILDLMGLPTPGRWLGQSLVPLLRGDRVKLSRPICAESRLMQSIVLPNGRKLIRDLHRGTREIYDLERDPGETRNLFDEGGAEREAEIDLLAAFFDVHTLKRPGYQPPYRRW